jgi:hypothetical protein
MRQLRSFRWFSVLAAPAVVVAVAMACGGSDEATSDNPPGNEGGPPSTEGGPPATPPEKVKQCQPQACTSDLAKGSAALRAGDFAGALAAYKCGENAESAFGAGFATVITALEGDSAKALLADFGFGPLRARDLFGPGGLLPRFAARWKGSGSLVRAAAGGPQDTSTIDRARQRLSSDGTAGSIAIRDVARGVRASISLGSMTAADLTPGKKVQVGCSAGTSYVSVSYSDLDQTCSGPFNCTAGQGDLVIVKGSTTPGAAVEYKLENVALTCRPRTGSGPETQARLSGSVSTFVVPSTVDRTGLHPLFSDENLSVSMPAGVTAQKVADDANGLASSLDAAACNFDAAGSVTASKVFDVPAEVFGGKPVPVTRGDAKVLAFFAASMAAGLRLVQAYTAPIELRGLVCDNRDGGTKCLPEADAVERINAGTGGIRDAAKVQAARDLVARALKSSTDAFDRLGPESLFIKDARTTPTLMKLFELATAATQSLDKGKTDMPRVAPPLRLDLKAFFAAPPNPDSVNVDPLVMKPDGGGWDFVEAFFDQTVPSASDLGWTRDSWKAYEYDKDGNTSGDLDGISRRLTGYDVFPEE